MLRRLRDRPEKVIAVVSHAAFLRLAVSQRRYFNADYRIFTFAEDDGKDLRLVEADETSGKGGMGLSDDNEVKIEPWDFPS